MEGAEGKSGGPPFFKETLAPKFDLGFKLLLYWLFFEPSRLVSWWFTLRYSMPGLG